MRAFSADYNICTVSDEQSPRGERDADSKTQDIRYSERNFLLNEILDWARRHWVD